MLRCCYHHVCFGDFRGLPLIESKVDASFKVYLNRVKQVLFIEGLIACVYHPS